MDCGVRVGAEQQVSKLSDEGRAIAEKMERLWKVWGGFEVSGL